MTWHLSKYKQDISTAQQRHLKKFYLQKIENPEFNTKVIVLEKNIYASTKINVFTNCRDRSVKHEKLSLLLRAGTDILFFFSNVYTLFHLYYIWAKRECKHLKKKKKDKRVSKNSPNSEEKNPQPFGSGQVKVFNQQKHNLRRIFTDMRNARAQR